MEPPWVTALCIILGIVIIFLLLALVSYFLVACWFRSSQPLVQAITVRASSRAADDDNESHEEEKSKSMSASHRRRISWYRTP